MEGNVKKKLLLLLLFLWYCLSVSIIAPLLIEYFFDEYSLLSELFAEFLSVIIPVLIVKMAKVKNKDQYLFEIKNILLKKVGAKRICASMIIIIAYYFCVQYIINGIHILFYIKTGDFGDVYYLSHPNVTTFILSVLTYAFLPAVFEEMHYRTFYYDSFKNDKTIMLLICSSITFASAHINLTTIINAFFIGLFLMMIYKKHFSFALIVLLHFIHNFLDILFTTYISMPYSMLNLLSKYANDKQNKAAILISFGIALFCLSIIMILLRYVMAKDNNGAETETKESFPSRHKAIEASIAAILFILSVVLIILKVY